MLMIQPTVFCLALVSNLVTGRSIDTGHNEVLVRDLNPSKVAYPPIMKLRIQRDECKRDVPPREWNQRTERHDCQQDLVLRRRDNINTDFPMYKINKDGTPVKEQTTRALDGRAYQDAQNGAALFIKSEPSASGIYKRTVNGAIFGGDYTMYLEATPPIIDKRRDVDEGAVAHKAVWKRNKFPNFGPGTDTIPHHLPRELNKTKDPVIIDKRTLDTTYGVEIAMFCDYECYNDHDGNDQEIRNHFSHLLNGMDYYYATIKDPELSIYLRLVAVYVQADGDPWTQDIAEDNNMVNGTKSLFRFLKWRIHELNNGRLEKHDHGMLMTGYDIYTTNKKGVNNPNVLGISPVGKICFAIFSGSIIETVPILSSMEFTTAAHELGHNLGADHDTPKDNDCPPEDTYIMKPSTGEVNLQKYKNSYQFSRCSIESIKKRIKTLDTMGTNCLKDAAERGADIPEVSAPGQAFGPDKQCEQTYKPGFKYLKTSMADHLICKSLACVETSSSAVMGGKVPALEKTSCGDKKWCVYGDCVYDDAAPSMRVPGEEYGLDAQCEYIRGTGNRFVDIPIAKKSLCNLLYCTADGEHVTTDNSGLSGAFRGTPCGNNKWCISGQCIEKGSTPSETPQPPPTEPPFRPTEGRPPSKPAAGIDDQCNKHVPGSEFARGKESEEIMCKSLFCNSGAQFFQLSGGAEDGTPCGDKMWCQSGECTYSEDAPSNPASCVYGDSRMLSCAEFECTDMARMMLSDGQMKTVSISELCCESCKSK